MPKIENHILEILSRCTFDGPRLKLPEQLDRADYVAVNKVLEANGGKWMKAAKCHVFGEDDAEAAIEQALATGEFHRVKQDLGQFDTPPAVVARLIELAEILPGMECLEPSAGVGNIVEGLLAAGGIVRANEIDAKRRKMLFERNYSRKAPNLMVGDRDFMEVPPRPKFDRVVMNPPFAKQADIDHVTHALRFLKPGGRLVAVMSAAVMWRTNRKTAAFTDLVMSVHDGNMEALPAGAFAESGTNVNACIVTVQT